MTNRKNRPVSAETLRLLIAYNPVTGELTWRKRAGNENFNSKHAGKPALAYQTKSGYLRGTVAGVSMLAHIAAWIIVKGKWPVGQVDHENGKRNDNRLSNLRITDATGNAKNRKSRTKSTSLPTGVTLDARRISNPYRARITVDGKLRTIGYFSSPELAYRAYLDSAKAFGFSARHGVPCHD